MPEEETIHISFTFKNVTEKEAEAEELQIDKFVTFCYGCFGLFIATVSAVFYANKKVTGIQTVFFIVLVLVYLPFVGFSGYILFLDVKHPNTEVVRVLHPASLLLVILTTIPIHLNFTILVILVTNISLILRQKFMVFPAL